MKMCRTCLGHYFPIAPMKHTGYKYCCQMQNRLLERSSHDCSKYATKVVQLSTALQRAVGRESVDLDFTSICLLRGPQGFSPGERVLRGGTYRVEVLQKR